MNAGSTDSYHWYTSKFDSRTLLFAVRVCKVSLVRIICVHACVICVSLALEITCAIYRLPGGCLNFKNSDSPGIYVPYYVRGTV